MSATTKNILAIYAIQDKQVLKYLSLHLQPLVKEFDIAFWKDAIHREQKWKPKSASRLEETDIFLLLLSNSFMYSPFIEQDEFKTIIDSYKAGTAMVIPILIDDCPWDAEFTSEDYNFSFKQLLVFPKNRMPIGDWNSTDDAFKEVTDHLSALLTPPATEISVEEQTTQESGQPLENLKNKKQITIDFFEGQEHHNAVSQNKEKAEVGAVAPKEKVHEKNILREEVEAKKASKKDKWLRQKTEIQKRIEKEKELKEKVKSDIKAKEKAEPQTIITPEEKQIVEEAKAKNETSITNKITYTEIVGPQKTFDAEEIERAVLAPKTERIRNGFAGQNYQFKTENTKEVDQKSKTGQKTKNILEIKKVRSGLIAFALVILGIWIFSRVSSVSENANTSYPESGTAEVGADSENSSANEAAAILELSVGDNYGDGIIFEVGPDNTNGKIASSDNLGPMPWQEAITIHERLGEGWRLPTLDELQTMYRTIGQGAANEGKFLDGLYWSATPYGEYQARLLRFKDGNTSYHYNKMVADRQFHVRAIRDFKR